MSKRILLVNEISSLSSGYSFYGRELLKRLVRAGYEVAELAAFASPDHENFSSYEESVPWKVYFNEDNVNVRNSAEFNADPFNVFGKFKFNDVAIDFKPTHCLFFRDTWMDSYIYESPYRKFFKIINMPPVDGFPQQDKWLSDFSDADAVLTYQDWSLGILKEQAGDKINLITSAPMAAGHNFFPCEADEVKTLREGIGLKQDDILVGTVMRNQRRKLFPELFRAFREFLDRQLETERQTGVSLPNVYLYCHTSYPDNSGWKIPYLLKQFGIASKVFFTYVCRDIRCQFAFSSKFLGAMAICPKCNQASCGMSDVGKSIPEENFRYIYNMFDLYVQYCTKEGFGSPVVEAAACGIPVAATNYSACEDTLKKLEGTPIRPALLWHEIETTVMGAYPDEEHFIQILQDFCSQDKKTRFKNKLKIRKLFEENYNSWDKTIKIWLDQIEKLDAPELGWESQPDIQPPMEWDDRVLQLSLYDYSVWLIDSVLRNPSKKYSYFHLKLIKDLNSGTCMNALPGTYVNDDSYYFNRNTPASFDKKAAYDYVKSIRNMINGWERKRVQVINSRR